MRAESTLKECAKDDFSNLSEFNLKRLRKAMEGTPLLDPLNLIFFAEQIFALNIAPDGLLPETILTMQELFLIYTFIFKKKEGDYFLGL